VALAPSLARFAPLPWLVARDGTLDLIERKEGDAADALGRIKAFHGQMGMFVRALAFLMSHGGEGLRQVSGDAVLNANYLLASLKDVMTPSFGGLSMHEVLFDDRFLGDSGVTTLDFAKALIDEGYHPMTMYFPLIVHGALLVEPTENESKESLDRFIAAMRELAQRAAAGDKAFFQAAPLSAPRRRLDEVAAARKPVLRWRPAAPPEATE
jgi:glycine dehydrogenase subunit 2